MEETVIKLDFVSYELLIDAISFAKNNALETKERKDYEQLQRDITNQQIRIQ